jgi:hypothetical protein
MNNFNGSAILAFFWSILASLIANAISPWLNAFLWGLCQAAVQLWLLGGGI